MGRIGAIESQVRDLTMIVANMRKIRLDGDIEGGYGSAGLALRVPPGFNWNKLSLGTKLVQIGADNSAAYVRVFPGFVEHHHGNGTSVYYAVAKTDVEITGAAPGADEYHVIYVEYTLGTSAAVAATTSNSTTEALALAGVDSEAPTLRRPLCCVKRASGSTNINLVRRYALGSISIMPIFGD